MIKDLRNRSFIIRLMSFSLPLWLTWKPLPANTSGMGAWL